MSKVEMPQPTWLMVERLERENARMMWALETILERPDSSFDLAKRALDDVAKGQSYERRE